MRGVTFHFFILHCTEDNVDSKFGDVFQYFIGSILLVQPDTTGTF